MCAATEPLFYTKIFWDWDGRKALRRLLRLLRTILKRPDLASLVWHISFLATTEQRAKPGTDWRCEGFMDVVEGCVDIINRAQFPDADVWIAALQQGVSEAFISIFISQLSMLNFLRLDYEFLKPGYANRMVKHALLSFSSFPQGVLSIFSRLQKVDYGRHNHDSPSYIHKWLFNDLRGYDKNKFIAWLCLPSLQRFDTHYLVLTGVTGLERRQREEDIKLNLRGLQTLFLTRSKIPEQDILFLLSQTPSLKNLHLGSIYERHDQLVPGHHLLAQALESVSDTDENLSIGVEYYSCCGECEEVEDDKPREEGLESWEPFRGILKRFTNLQNQWELEICNAIPPKHPHPVMSLCDL